MCQKIVCLLVFSKSVNVNQLQNPVHLSVAQLFSQKSSHVANNFGEVSFHFFVHCKVDIGMTLTLPCVQNMIKKWVVGLFSRLEELCQLGKCSHKPSHLPMIEPGDSGIFHIPANIDDLETM